MFSLAYASNLALLINTKFRNTMSKKCKYQQNSSNRHILNYNNLKFETKVLKYSVENLINFLY